MTRPTQRSDPEKGAPCLRQLLCSTFPWRGWGRPCVALPGLRFLTPWLIGWLFSLFPAHAAEQILVFKDGKTLAYPYVKIRGDTVVVEMRINDRVEEAVYPIAQIASLRWTVPEAWTDAEKLLAENRDVEAIPLLESVRGTFAPFRNIPGSYWLAAAGKLIDLYGKWERWDEFDLLFEEIGTSGLVSDPLVQVRLDRYRMIRLLARGDFEGAEALAQKLQSVAREEEDVAWLDLVRAEILLSRQQPEEALYACLRLPVFHASLTSLQARALALSVRAFEGMRLPLEADRALAELQESHPASRETEWATAWLAEVRKPRTRVP